MPTGALRLTDLICPYYKAYVKPRLGRVSLRRKLIPITGTVLMFHL